VTSRQRIVLLAIAAVVLAGGIALAASSGGDDGGEQSAETTPAQTQAAETEPGETQRAAPPKPRVESIRIRGGRPVGGVKTLRYERGDTIRLRFVADAPGEVHVHGFDEEYPVGPGGPRVVRMKADLEGIFEIEDHGSGELLAKLEIRPK
jgi:FtsP/CotA-like multicopper oxidase with cupredoxin domain